MHENIYMINHVHIKPLFTGLNLPLDSLNNLSTLVPWTHRIRPMPYIQKISHALQSAPDVLKLSPYLISYPLIPLLVITQQSDNQVTWSIVPIL